MVVLAQEGTLLDQGYDYMFWSNADANGLFSIPNIRAGTYAVHVYATQGAVLDDVAHGEVVAASVTVAVGANDLGTLTWSPPYQAKLLWSIGTADHSSGEFRFDPSLPPGPTNVASAIGRRYGTSATDPIWNLPPATTTYSVGTSQPSTDWYFAQSVTGTWTVNFDLTTVPPGGGYLAIGLAGAARNPSLVVAVNGHQVASQRLGNDSSLYRSALQGGRPELILATVPAADLYVGANTATFQLTNGTGGTGLFYDAITFSSD
jgi:rhamnogalacturonan endolyase